VQEKTGTKLWLNCPKPLLAALKREQRKTNREFIFHHAYDAPFANAQTLSHAIRNRLEALKVEGYTMHGLRKNAGMELAEAGCTVEEIAAALGIKLSDLFDRAKAAKRKGGGAPIHIPPNNQSSDHPKHGSGLTLEAYAAAKKLPIEFLRGCGLSDCPYEGNPAVRMPYLGPLGEVLAVRFRLAERGDNRFRWKSGTKVCLYGLNRIEQAREAGEVVLVEGESDVHTLWHHSIPALGLPGAANWNEGRDVQHFDGIERIYVVVEPDKGGEAVRKMALPIPNSAPRLDHRAASTGEGSVSSSP